MIDFSPNSESNILVNFTDDSAPLTGATVTLTVVSPTNVTILNAVSATENGNGFYSCVIPAASLSVLGTYFVTWNVTAPKLIEYKTTFVVGYKSQYDFSLLTLRHNIARLVEGSRLFYLGSVGTNSTATSIIDPTRVEPDGHHAGSWFYVYTGAAQGQERQVSANSPTGTSLTLAYALSPVPTTGDLYEDHHEFSVDDYNNAIRNAMTEVEDEVFVPISWDQGVINSSTFEYDIPAGFSHINEVQVRLDAGKYVTVVPACWKVIRANRKLWLHPNIVYSYPGFYFRILGFRPPTEMLGDEAGCDVHPSYIINKAAAILCESKIRNSQTPGEWSTRAQMYEAKASSFISKINKVMPSNLRRVS